MNYIIPLRLPLSLLETWVCGLHNSEHTGIVFKNPTDVISTVHTYYYYYHHSVLRSSPTESVNFVFCCRYDNFAFEIYVFSFFCHQFDEHTFIFLVFHLRSHRLSSHIHAPCPKPTPHTHARALAHTVSPFISLLLILRTVSSFCRI